MSRTAMILGVFGQDGAYLASALVSCGYSVIGVGRPGGSSDRSGLDLLSIGDAVAFETVDLAQGDQICSLLRRHKPDEIYNLAGSSSVAQSFLDPVHSVVTDVGVACNVMEAVRLTCPETRIFQALSSEIFAGSATQPQTEKVAARPASPYGYGKAAVKSSMDMYRDLYGLYVSGGILYNHESPLRGEKFVSRKITRGFVSRCLSGGDPLGLGNLDAKRDWGFAGDYVNAMTLMLSAERGDDFVVATGQLRSVRDLCSSIAAEIGREIVWDGVGIGERGFCRTSGEVLVEVDERFYRPVDVATLVGDSSKVADLLGWRRAIDFEQLVAMCTRAEVKRLRGLPLTSFDLWGDGRA